VLQTACSATDSMYSFKSVAYGFGLLPDQMPP
jgi:hypothetical protein